MDSKPGDINNTKRKLRLANNGKGAYFEQVCNTGWIPIELFV